MTKGGGFCVAFPRPNPLCLQFVDLSTHHNRPPLRARRRHPRAICSLCSAPIRAKVGDYLGDR